MKSKQEVLDLKTKDDVRAYVKGNKDIFNMRPNADAVKEYSVAELIHMYDILTDCEYVDAPDMKRKEMIRLITYYVQEHKLKDVV